MSNDPPATNSVPTKAGLPRRRRRWLQFSLRGLLALMFITACACSWIAYKVRAIQKQDRAVQLLVKNGYVVRANEVADYKSFWEKYSFYSLAPPPPSFPARSWLGTILGCDDSDVIAVEINSDLIVGHAYLEPKRNGQDPEKLLEQSLIDLESLPALKGLALTGCEVNDARLGLIPHLPNLRHLVLTDTTVSDSGLESISQFTELQSLRIENSSGNRLWTENGIERLRHLLPRLHIDFPVRHPIL